MGVKSATESFSSALNLDKNIGDYGTILATLLLIIKAKNHSSLVLIASANMMKQNLKLSSPPKRILIISMRYLGDMLLTTPLIRTIKQAYPNAEIDVLVYDATKGMLEGNNDIRTIIGSPARPKVNDYKRIIKLIFRKYDLSISTQTGDRQFIYSLLAAKKRISFVPHRSETGWWKRYFIHACLKFNNSDNHTVLELLRLSEVLGLSPHYELVPPSSSIFNVPQDFDIEERYAVLHVHPQWTYKQWHQQGWIDVIDYLNSQGLKLVLSGGPDKKEQQYITEIQQQRPQATLDIAGKVSLAELSHIIEHAQLFIGPDTGITHLAAASNTPVIALFGPTNPIKWTPWPRQYAKNRNPFMLKGSQSVNNIYLVQGGGDCVPCDLEGCDQHRMSRSACLDRLDSETVIHSIQQALIDSQ